MQVQDNTAKKPPDFDWELFLVNYSVSLTCRTAEAREARQLEAGKDLGDSAHATPAGIDAGMWQLFLQLKDN